MPKGDEKYVLSENLLIKYPDLKDCFTKKGKLNMKKHKVILDIITSDEDKEKFISIFKIKGKQNEKVAVEEVIEEEVEEKEKPKVVVKVKKGKKIVEKVEEVVEKEKPKVVVKVKKEKK